jgi:hypothetical protein
MRVGTPIRSLLIVLGALVVFAAIATLTHQRPGPVAGRATAPATAIITVPAQTVVHATAAGTRQPSAHVPAASRPAAPAVQRLPGTAGMRAYIDPETGTFGAPSPEVLRAEAANRNLQAVEETAQVVKLANGAEMLIGGPPDYVVAQRDANGKLVIRTVTDPRQARASGAVPATRPVER